MSKLRRFAIFTVGMSTVAVGQTGPGFQNLDALDALIATSLGAPAGVRGGAAMPLDRRLRLATCQEEIGVAPPRQGAIVVSCGANSWRIRVAVLPATSPAATERDEEAGVASQPAVERGDQIRATVVGSGFSVSTTAVAEQSGVVGERIRIRIDGQSRPTYATVTAPGQVQM